MGGHTSTTTKINQEIINKNVKQTNNNLTTTNDSYDINRTNTSIQDGNRIAGKSVDLSNNGNTGLRCVGLKAGDPRCKSGLAALGLGGLQELKSGGGSGMSRPGPCGLQELKSGGRSSMAGNPCGLQDLKLVRSGGLLYMLI